MKKYILSALAGAMAMLIAIAAMATIHGNKAQHPKDYEHIDYISTIAAEECYVCGDNGDTLASAFWGEDNVGLINLNRGMQHPEQCYYPLVPGYETAGIVVATPDIDVDLSRIPESARNLKVGDRVMINECRQYGNVCSAWGGGSEYTIKDSFTTNDIIYQTQNSVDIQ